MFDRLRRRLERFARPEEKIQREQLAHLLQTHPGLIYSGVFVAGIMALLAMPDIPRADVSIWFVMVAGVGIVRLAFTFAMRRKPAADPQFAIRLLAGAGFVNGCVWALLLLWHPNLADGNGPWLFVVVSAVCAGAVLRGNAEASVSIAFVFPLLSALVYKLFASQDFAAALSAVAVAYYLVFLVVSCFKNEAKFVDAMRVRNEMEDRAREAMLYQAAMKDSPFGMLIVLPDYRIVDANPAICRIFGCTRQEMLDDGMSRFTHPENMEDTLETYQKLLRGEVDKITVEKRNLRANGEVFWTYSERTAVRDPATGELAYVIVQLEDIDQFKRDEIALKESLAKEKLTVELADVGTCHYHPETDTAIWSDRLYDIFQADPETCDTSFSSFLERFHPDDRDKIECLLKSLTGSEYPETGSRWISARVVRSSGEVRYLRVMASRQDEADEGTFSILSVYRDVTDEHFAASRLAEEHNKLEKQLTLTRMTTEVSGLGTFEYDLENDRFTFDPALSAIYGVSPEDYPKTQDEWLAKIHPDDRGRIAAGVKALHTGQENNNDWHYSIVRPDGEVRHLHVRGTVTRKPGENKIVRVGAALDETEKVQRDRQLAEDRTKLASALFKSRLAMETSGLGEFTFKLRTGEAEWNDRLYEIFGVGRDWDKSPEGFLELIHPDDRDEVRRKMRRNFAKGTLDDISVRNFRIVCPSGEVRHVRMNVASLPGAGEDAEPVFLGVVADITDEVRYTQRLEEERLKLEHSLIVSRIAMETAGLGEYTYDASAFRGTWNDRIYEIFGVPLDYEPTAAGFLALIHPDDRDRVRQHLTEHAAGSGLSSEDSSRVIEYRIVRPNDGQVRHIRMASRKLSSVKGQGGGIRIGVLQDITESVKVTDRLTYQAFSDSLTGLANRRAFEEQLARRLQDASPRRARDFLMLIDLDHFKIVNDVCGHSVGDQLLKDIADIFGAQMRKSDFVARLGGDEFAVIMYGTTEDFAIDKADEIIQAVQEYRITHEGKSFKVSASIGISEIAPGSEASQLMVQADTACLTAKNAGRGCCHLFSSDDATVVNIKHLQSWYQRIQDGLENDKFRLYLQKVVREDCSVAGYEALVRYVDGGKAYSPASFMEAARRHDMLPSLDRHVLSGALELLKSPGFNTAERGDRYLSVNLSAASVANSEFQKWLLKTMESSSHMACRLWLELTETDRLRWTEEVDGFLQHLRSMGIRFFLDDFGTGYNSFDLLKKISVDGLKIDHSVTDNITTDTVDQALVKASLIIANDRKLDIVAEGVEDEESFRYLTSLGIGKFQGYYFHRPEDAMTAIPQPGLNAGHGIR